jgi:hypothetical protein
MTLEEAMTEYDKAREAVVRAERQLEEARWRRDQIRRGLLQSLDQPPAAAPAEKWEADARAIPGQEHLHGKSYRLGFVDGRESIADRLSGFHCYVCGHSGWCLDGPICQALCGEVGAEKKCGCNCAQVQREDSIHGKPTCPGSGNPLGTFTLPTGVHWPRACQACGAWGWRHLNDGDLAPAHTSYQIKPPPLSEPEGAFLKPMPNPSEEEHASALFAKHFGDLK